MMDQPATRAVEQFVHAELSAGRRGRAARRIRRHARGSRGGDGGNPARADANRARPKSACRRTRRSGCCSGRAARRRFPPWDASRPTTTASTARFRARRCRACCARSPRGRRSTDLRCANVFHAGDGNLHPLILFDANKPGEAERTIEFGDRILQAVHRSRRHDHRRARRRRREAVVDVRAVHVGGARALPRHQASVRRATACSIRARPCRRCTAAANSARCTCTPGRCRIPTCRVSERMRRGSTMNARDRICAPARRPPTSPPSSTR